MRTLEIDDYVLATASKSDLREWEREPLFTPEARRLFGISVTRDAEHCRTLVTAPQAVFDMLMERPIWQTTLVVASRK